MAKIGKQSIEEIASTRDERLAARLQDAQARAAAKVEHDAEAESRRYRGKSERYGRDMQVLAETSGLTGTIDYRLIGNKTLLATGPNEITRERGYFTKISKVTRTDADGNAYVARRQTDKRNGAQETIDFDPSGNLADKLVSRADGSTASNWTRDENGILMRTAYSSKDGAVSEVMSYPVEEVDGRVYRHLIRQRGSTTEVFERNDRGDLTLLERNAKYSSALTIRSADRQTSSTTTTRAGGFISKSYQSRLDTDGNEIARDVTSNRKLFNKRSATYDEVTGMLATVKHTVGKLYKSDTAYLDENTKRVTKKMLGVTVRTKLASVTGAERQAQVQRVSEAQRHRQTWAEKAAKALLHGHQQMHNTPRTSGSLSARLETTPPHIPQPTETINRSATAANLPWGELPPQPDAVLRTPDAAPSPYEFSLRDYQHSIADSNRSAFNVSGAASPAISENSSFREINDQDPLGNKKSYASSMRSDSSDDFPASLAATPFGASITRAPSPVLGGNSDLTQHDTYTAKIGTFAETLARQGSLQNAIERSPQTTQPKDMDLSAILAVSSPGPVVGENRSNSLPAIQQVAAQASSQDYAADTPRSADTPKPGTFAETLARQGSLQNAIERSPQTTQPKDMDLSAILAASMPGPVATNARNEVMQRADGRSVGR